MQRLDELNRFYAILTTLEQKAGTKIIHECDNKMYWPAYGVYFFFETGEMRDDLQQFRVVRVGSNADLQETDSNLWSDLRQHRGTIAGKFAGGGNHRASFFRLHIGTSLINKEGIRCDSWIEEEIANARIRKAEHQLEVRVSNLINTMPFLWLEVNNSEQARYIEKNSIALLSNFGKPPIDKPSPGWLGNYCNNSYVKTSGLWNVDYVEDQYNAAFLDELAQLV
ncbi:MAG: hypothetical protein PHT79_00990 [Syntrophomonadaceae bacterium]|nr:hypothetical protein [Syntrophomonadaceae bacterium]MDD4548326.1 hypothetical protein [Syntrophomonadaceae bacterium]